LTYVRTLKRIREDKTNYRKRSAILIGRHLFITIKISDQNVTARVLKPTPTGDIVIASAHSRELAKHGWKGAFNNLPACYLTGMLLGKKAAEKTLSTAVLYIGKNHFTSRVGACAKGIVDAGISMPVSRESLPDDERISGHHIAEYSRTLKEDPETYNSRFSAILKNGLNPEHYPSHFEEIKSKISGAPAEKVVPKKDEKEALTKKEKGGGRKQK
jgi:large subunit ribosomal protein L18